MTYIKGRHVDGCDYIKPMYYECLRCGLEILAEDKMLINDYGDFAHDDCIGWDDLNENWTETDR